MRLLDHPQWDKCIGKNDTMRLLGLAFLETSCRLGIVEWLGSIGYYLESLPNFWMSGSSSCILDVRSLTW